MVDIELEVEVEVETEVEVEEVMSPFVSRRGSAAAALRRSRTKTALKSFSARCNDLNDLLRELRRNRRELGDELRTFCQHCTDGTLSSWSGAAPQALTPPTRCGDQVTTSRKHVVVVSPKFDRVTKALDNSEEVDYGKMLRFDADTGAGITKSSLKAKSSVKSSMKLSASERMRERGSLSPSSSAPLVGIGGAPSARPVVGIGAKGATQTWHTAAPSLLAPVKLAKHGRHRDADGVTY